MGNRAGSSPASRTIKYLLKFVCKVIISLNYLPLILTITYNNGIVCIDLGLPRFFYIWPFDGREIKGVFGPTSKCKSVGNKFKEGHILIVQIQEEHKCSLTWRS